MSKVLRASVLLCLITAACAGGSQGTATPESEQTRARIENRASLDMDIYVRRNDGKSNRLGFVAGGEITYFGLPPTLTAGATWVRFEARPVRSSGQPVLSEIFPVKMGEEISWSIPPQ
ncbi:MAG: hypothetical protein ACJ8A6_13200 [Gemmatimonadales bacterium]